MTFGTVQVNNTEVIPFSTADLSWSCLACNLDTNDLPTRYSFTLCKTNQKVNVNVVIIMLKINQ